MLSKDKLDRLKFHASQIAAQLILHIQPNGKVHAVSDGQVYEDLASEHHVLEVLSNLDTRIMRFSSDSVLANLAKANARPYHPFVLDSFANFPDLIGEPQLTDLLYEEVAPQLENGAIPKYTAFIEGGNYFSTLWAMKILLKSQSEKLDKRKRKAVEYLIREEKIEASTITQDGFLLWILSKYRPTEHQARIRAIAASLIERAEKRPYLWYGGRVPLMTTIFLLQDLFAVREYLEDWATLSVRFEQSLEYIFDLDHDLDQPPSVITEEFRHYGESLKFETYAQSVVLISQYLNSIGDVSLPYIVNQLLIGSLSEQNFKLRYDLTLIDQEFKTYLNLYQDMHRSFKHYDDILGTLWKVAPLQRSIFIMMPFRFDDITYVTIRDEIKRAAKEEGFQAFLTTDRQVMPTLWDNLVANMLACQYGIAVVTPEHVLDAMERHGEPRILHNPNVALEFGFMVSRGARRVLLLTHDLKALPADLRGFLVEQFDIKMPSKDIFLIVQKWLQQIKKAEMDGSGDQNGSALH